MRGGVHNVVLHLVVFNVLCNDVWCLVVWYCICSNMMGCVVCVIHCGYLCGTLCWVLFVCVWYSMCIYYIIVLVNQNIAHNHRF